MTWKNQLAERRTGEACLAAGLGAVVTAIAMQCGACTPAERQTLATDARWADGNVLLPFTKAACEVVQESPNPPAGYVDLACTWIEGVEAYLASDPADSGAGGNVKAPATVRMRVTVASAKAFAAAHPKVLALPKGL